MKKLFYLLLIIGFNQTAKADTIDFWHIYINKTKIKEFTHYYKKREIILKLDSLKANDSITVRYFRDTPCDECPTLLTVEDEKHHVFITSMGSGTFNPISFSVNTLIELRKQGYKQTFEVYYADNVIKSRSDRTLLFTIIFE